MLQIELQEADGRCINRELELGKHTLGRSLFADVRVKDKALEKLHLSIEVMTEEVVITALRGADFSVAGESQQRLINPLPQTLLRLGQSEIKIIDTPATGIGSVPAPVVSVSAEALVQTARETVKPEQGASVSTQQPQQPRPVADVPESANLDSQTAVAPHIWIELKKQLQQKIMEKLDLYQRSLVDNYSDAELREEASRMARQIIRAGEIQLPEDADQALLLKETVAESIGLGLLEPLLEDESVTEIMVNGPDKVYIERFGQLQKSTACFTGNASLISVIERIVAPLGRRIDEGSPMVDARLPDGSRVNAIIPPLSLIGPVITIRKFSKQRFNLQRLVDFNSLSSDMAAFLEICVQHRKNIVVAGGTGSGKTTFLNALSDCIPDSDRIVTIEDAAELQLAQDHVISLESRPPNVEHQGEVSTRDLVKNALRMRPDRIVVGECRGSEALDMLQAMNTGHDGSLTTAHANSPRDLLSRLEVMVLMAGMDMPVKVIREQVASAVDIIVHQSRFADGKRRVTAIVEVDGLEGDVVLMQKIFEFKQTGILTDGSIQGHHRSMGIAPRFYDELRDSGIDLDRTMFSEAAI